MEAWMSEHATIKSGRECDVCGLAHDEGIHEATLSVHEWFRGQVTRYLQDPEEPAAQVA
jgi:hypothetical protein